MSADEPVTIHDLFHKRLQASNDCNAAVGVLNKKRTRLIPLLGLVFVLAIIGSATLHDAWKLLVLPLAGFYVYGRIRLGKLDKDLNEVMLQWRQHLGAMDGINDIMMHCRDELNGYHIVSSALNERHKRLTKNALS